MIYCKSPDPDCPKLLCGRPLPCTIHTAVIDLERDPPTISAPEMTVDQLKRLTEVAEVLSNG